jgi:Tol biopolymer transport system component
MDLPGTEMGVTRSQKLIKAVIAAGAVSTLVCGYIYFFTKVPPSQSQSIVISSGPYRVSPLFIVTKDSSTPVTVTVGGTEKKALDMVHLKDGSTLYSLMESETPLSSNIYRVDAQGTVTQLTNTVSAKFNMSVDPSGAHVVYEESVIKDVQDLQKFPWGITQLTLDTKTVEHITNGVQPRYINSGKLLIAQMDGAKLYPARNAGTASGTPLLPSKLYSLYAVSEDGTHLAAFNGKTGKIDVFDITSAGTLSYVRSEKTSRQPQSLIFSGSSLMSFESTMSSKGAVYSVTTYGGKQWSIISQKGPVAQRFLYAEK